MKERQEIHCHACDRWVQFEIDLAVNGNHVLHCPNCEHEHCRVVKNGEITDIRWDQRNGPTIQMYTAGYTNQAIYTINLTATTSSSTQYIQPLWAQSGYWNS